MKTQEEIIADVLEEERKYKELLLLYEGNWQALQEMDWMYQEGVRVDEIERVIRNK